MNAERERGSSRITDCDGGSDASAIAANVSMMRLFSDNEHRLFFGALYWSKHNVDEARCFYLAVRVIYILYYTLKIKTLNIIRS